ncbi:MAG: excinuclease ABC subunit UvrC [Patescibacteria group bacterium]
MTKNKIKRLPHSPGIYKFLDVEGQIIYVGKANSLANRVGQYFQKNLKDGKTLQLVKNISDIGFIEVFSELEALILEAELIKKYHPKYNINLKDDKSYLYIIIRKEGDFKKILTARKSDIIKGDSCFGPYPDAYTARYILRSIRRIFPFRDCSMSKFSKYKKLGSPCLYGHIGLCMSPCLGNVSQQEYELTIKRVVRFLRGQQQNVVRELQRKMSQASKKLSYEEAEKIRKILKKYEYIQQSFRAPREFMENPYLVDDICEMGLKELADVLPVLNKLPTRIECFDVANISGKDAAVSMVVALNGRLERQEYKKFKIKLKDTPDDVFMLKEALTRRFLHETRENLAHWGLPDLVVADGGKGQVGVATDVITALGLDIPVIGLAKKEETIVYRDHHCDYKELRLAKTSEALKLLQRLRDESHRFARVYHHHLRSKNIGW